MFRLGAGYEFKLGKNLTLAPEAQVDFVAGGTKVYVVAIALGYGFQSSYIIALNGGGTDLLSGDLESSPAPQH